MVTTARGPVEHAVVGIGAPVLVLHSSQAGIDAAQLIARFLPKDTFAAVLVRGRATSAPLSSGPSIDVEADLLAALLGRPRIEQVAVHCWSGGGSATYRLAVRHHTGSGSGRVRCRKRGLPDAELKFVDRLLFHTRAGNKLLGYLAAKQPEQFVSGVLAAEAR